MPVRDVAWRSAWRIIASRYPPVRLFERLTPDAAVSDALIALELLTNPRVRDEIGDIALVDPAERVAGPGSSYVMASFTHLNPKGSRFGDGTFGVYYAAAEFETAVAETVFHFEAFARDSADPPRMEDMRVLVGALHATLEDVGALAADEATRVLDPDAYDHARVYGRALREAGSAGVVYPSVRRRGGECAGVFRPRAVGVPRQERHLKYHWDGARVARYFDYARDAWIEV